MPVIPSGVEESLNIFETIQDVSTSLDMAKRLFDTLYVYHDIGSRGAAMNMAIDEALLEMATIPSIRFYLWNSPALSFGYFGCFADVASHAAQRDLVRRWTGGGIVFHGQDLTYSIIVPRDDPAFAASSMWIYERIHTALCEALVAIGKRAELLPAAAVCDRRTIQDRSIHNWEITGTETNTTVTDRRYSDCFENPVRTDVLVDGRKVAGAAQRRTRAGLLQQGSIQHIDVGNGLAERFAGELSPKAEIRQISDEVLMRAEIIATKKYATASWLRRR